MRALSVFFIALILVAALPGTVPAVPVPPGPVSLNQPDGKAFAAGMEGDEFGIIVTTSDGYTVVRTPEGWWQYAVRGSDGRLEASGISVGSADPAARGLAKGLLPSAEVRADAERKRLEARRGRGIHPVVAARKKEVLDAAAAPGGDADSLEPAFAEAPASFHLAVLLIEFPLDMTLYSAAVPHTFEPQQFDELFFSNGTYITTPLGGPAYGSMSDYYAATSYGQFTLTGEIFPWVEADRGQRYYNETAGGAVLLQEEAVLKSGVDLSQFDGYAIIFAGKASSSGELWPRANRGGPWYQSSEKFNAGEDITIVGVNCHEFGHVLGLTDLYYAPYNVGNWGLMGTGA